ncbi:MAG TPA: glycosyltransferase family 4 protein [Elusimicrobiota bacterium]|nr:glycosyltransferase family 4 protein [Elusimicrobiota bacterium]
MRILHIIDERWDSGLTHYALSLAGALKAAGHSVSVAAYRDRPAATEAVRGGLELLELDDKITFYRRGRAGSFDVINAHTGSGHLWGYLLSLGTRTALIRTRGDARPVRKRWWGAMLYGRTDRVIAASKMIEVQYHARLDYPEERTHTIYPGQPVSPFVPEPPGPVRIALVGRLDPVKGHDDFLRAIKDIAAEVPEAVFEVVGEEKNIRRASLERLAGELSLGRKVRFQGRIDDVGGFMRSCHIGVIASVGSEAISRVCLEWFSCGRPVVGTAVGCLPELLSSGDNGFLVPPQNPRIMGQCILALIRKGDMRRSMGRRAHELASTRYGMTMMVQQTLNVYEEAIRLRGETR